MSDAHVIAEVVDFVTLQLGLQKGREYRGISLERMDEIAGTPARYFSKVLAPGKLRRVTMDSLTLALAALGLKMLIVEDPEQFARVQTRHEQRNGTVVRNGTIHRVLSRRFMKKIAVKGGEARMDQLMTSRRLVSHQRAAGKASAAKRWGKTAPPAMAQRRLRSDG